MLINQVKVQPVATTTAIFPPPCFPTFDASVFPSFNLINFCECSRGRGRGGGPLCQSLSISLIKQGLIKEPPLPMQVPGLSHIRHNLLDKNNTSKEIMSRVKSNSRRIVTRGATPRSTPDNNVHDCNTFLRVPACVPYMFIGFATDNKLTSCSDGFIVVTNQGQIIYLFFLHFFR